MGMKTASADSNPPGGISPVATAARIVAILAALGAWSVVGFAELHRHGRFEVDGAVLAIVVSSLIVALLCGWIPTGFSFSLSSLCAMLAGFVVILVALGVDPSWQAWQLATRIFGDPPIGIWQDDPRFGYAHRPGARGTHLHHSFLVTYKIDAEGNRRTPSEASTHQVVFLGGSVTFGHGVEDDEAYPALLARDGFSGWNVRNRAVMGWGTAHAYLALQDEMSRPDPPDVVFYGWISLHAIRNYIASEWLDALAPYDRRHPHFEVENGRLTYRGVVGAEAGMAASPELEARQLAITLKLLSEMKRLSDARGARFAVLLLPFRNQDEELNQTVVATLDAEGIEHFDLRAVPGSYFPHDGHPTQLWHENIARAISNSAGIRRFMAIGQAPKETGLAVPGRLRLGQPSP